MMITINTQVLKIGNQIIIIIIISSSSSVLEFYELE